LPRTLVHLSPGAWLLTRCPPGAFASLDMPYLPFLFFFALFINVYLARSSGYPGCGIDPSRLFLWVFSLLSCWISPTLGFRIFAFGRRWHQRQRCLLFTILLTTAGLAWRFFLLFCFLESKAKSPWEETFAMRDALRLIDRLIHLLGLLRIPFVILPCSRKDYRSCYKLLATATLLPNSNRIEAKFHITIIPVSLLSFIRKMLLCLRCTQTFRQSRLLSEFFSSY
jgi:hypothetical protein